MECDSHGVCIRIKKNYKRQAIRECAYNPAYERDLRENGQLGQRALILRVLIRDLLES